MVEQKSDKPNCKKTNFENDDMNPALRRDSGLLSSQTYRANDFNRTDELIRTLSDEYENKRARQVFEWEAIRRQNVQRTV